MATATEIGLIDEQRFNIETKKRSAISVLKKRSAISVLLIVAILTIALFLGLFVLELSQILTLTG